ncbi:MAG: hypothetical protein IJW22_05165, partial [Clostridia bacterium]|nr:hypothetical protein [Clostridia bacterium]
MLYDVYEKRILKLARILDFLRRNARTLLIALTVVVVTTTTLLATKGIAGKTTCEATYTYGETVSCDGGAFLSRVHFEYKGADGTWSETPPRFPGAYLVRSVGFSITGKPRYGKETPFTILPRTVDVQVSDTHICYGELPSVSAELPFGDRVLCDSVAYANILHTSTTVTPNKDAVRIIAANGSDVTSAYEICTVSTDITFDGREISLTVSDATHVYDALSFFYKEYELSGGTLAEGDTLQATFDQSLVDVGSTKNQPSWRILNKQSQDVTHHYRINETVGNLTVEQRPLVISTGNTIGTYNAEAHSQKSYSLAQGTTLVTGHRLGVVSFTAAIDAGVHENQLGFCVLDASGRDVTANYAILVECGTIEISPRTVMASTHSGSFVYDGTAQTHKSADVYGLLQGHTFDVTEATSLTDVGAAQNLLTLCIFAADGTDVTHNYDISFTYYGTLIVTERPVVLRTASDSWIYDGEPHYTHELEPLSELRLVEGHEIVVMEGTTITEAGTLPNEIVAYRVVDKDGNDMDANYSIKIESGTLTVEKRPVILRPADTEYVYDGLPHGGGAPILSETSPYGLVKGHEVTATVTGTQTDVGTALSELLSPAIKAGNTDMTHNYDISVTEGSITVTPRPIFIVITDADKIYDGTPLTSNAFTVEPVEPHTFALVEGHRVTDVVTTSSQTDAGSSENDFASCLVTDGTRDVTHNYECRGIAGMLTVTPRPITVISGSAEKAYDGTPLVCHDPILLTKGSLVLDHYLDMQATGTLTEVGTVPNTIEGTMRDGSDTDVGKNYKITYDRGTLKVLPRALILVTTGSASAPYTGTPLVCEEVVYTFLSGDLLEGHLITVVTTGSQTEIGQSYNTFDITITDQLGEDVSRFYDIEKSLGLLEVYEPEEDEEGGSGGGGSGEGGSGEGGSGGGGSGEG